MVVVRAVDADPASQRNHDAGRGAVAVRDHGP